MALADDIFGYSYKLAANGTSAIRYARATFGARMLMSFLEWRRDNPGQVASQEVQAYARLLQDWMRLKDYAYVLQFETDDCNVAFLKVGASIALDRESDQSETEWKKSAAKSFEANGHATEEALHPFRPDCYCAALSRAQRRYRYRVFTGNALPVEWGFVSRGHAAYCRWLGLHADPGVRHAIASMATALTERSSALG